MENEKDTQPQESRAFKSLFHHPNFNALSGTVTIISAILAIYFWRDSIKEPRIFCYFSPGRTPIVQKGKLENLSVSFLGNAIQGDLSSAELQIWNDGKQSVRKINILKPITIRTPNSEPIYQIVAQSTRDVTGVQVGGGSNGVLTVSWDILEQGDGTKIQFLYNGNIHLPLIFDGIIEGQKSLGYLVSSKRDNPFKGLVLLVVFVAVSIPSIGVWTKFLNSFIFKRFPDWAKRKPWPTWSSFIVIPSLLIAFLPAVLLAWLVGNYCFHDVKPPFGF